MAVVSLVASPSALAGEAGLDPSFGAGGRVVSDFGATEAHARVGDLAPNGSLVVAGLSCTLPPVAGRTCDPDRGWGLRVRPYDIAIDALGWAGAAADRGGG